MQAYVISTLICQHSEDRPHRLLIECDCGNKGNAKLEREKNPPYRMLVTCSMCCEAVAFAVVCCKPILWGQVNLLEVIG